MAIEKQVLTESRKLKVFLCHAEEDTNTIFPIFEQLINEGWISPWLDKKNLLPGQNWKLEIEHAIQEADAVLVFLSVSSINKEGNVMGEMNKALEIAENKPEGTIYCIPIRLDNCIVPKKLAKWQYLDYFTDDNPYGKLLESLVVRASSIEVDVNVRKNAEEKNNPIPFDKD